PPGHEIRVVCILSTRRACQRASSLRLYLLHVIVRASVKSTRPERQTMTRFQQIVTVVGGSGFLGRYVVRDLAKKGYTVRVICRHPEMAQHLKPSGHVGQIVLQQGDITRPETIKGKLEGSIAVINLVGILFERGRQKFSDVHAKGAEALAKEAWKS